MIFLSIQTISAQTSKSEVTSSLKVKDLNSSNTIEMLQEELPCVINVKIKQEKEHTSVFVEESCDLTTEIMEKLRAKAGLEKEDQQVKDKPKGNLITGR